jgi:hypothetical protein
MPCCPGRVNRLSPLRFVADGSLTAFALWRMAYGPLTAFALWPARFTRLMAYSV